MSETPRQRRHSADQAFQDSLAQLRSAFEEAGSAQAAPDAAESAPETDIDQSLESAVADIEEFFRRPDRDCPDQPSD